MQPQPVTIQPKHPHPRPAGMGYQCDAVYRNPDYHPDDDKPFLIRCNDPATVRMIIAEPTDTYAVKRCDGCAGVMRAKEANGATFEILAEQQI